MLFQCISIALSTYRIVEVKAPILCAPCHLCTTASFQTLDTAVSLVNGFYFCNEVYRHGPSFFSLFGQMHYATQLLCCTLTRSYMTSVPCLYPTLKRLLPLQLCDAAIHLKATGSSACQYFVSYLCRAFIIKRVSNVGPSGLFTGGRSICRARRECPFLIAFFLSSLLSLFYVAMLALTCATMISLCSCMSRPPRVPRRRLLRCGLTMRHNLRCGGMSSTCAECCADCANSSWARCPRHGFQYDNHNFNFGHTSLP